MLPYDEQGIIEAINRINNIDTKDEKSLDSIRREFDHLFINRYATDVFTLNAPKCLFRARKGENCSIDKLLFPKEAKINRLNKEGQVVLYVADSVETAAREIKAKHDDVITIIEITTNSNLLVGHLGFEKPYADATNSLTAEEKLIYNFIHDIFTQIIEEGEEHKYRKTIALANIILEIRNVYPIDGILYPSIANNMKSYNICLLPDILDFKECPMKVHLFRVQECKSPEFIKSAKRITADGKIIW